MRGEFSENSFETFAHFLGKPLFQPNNRQVTHKQTMKLSCFTVSCSCWSISLRFALIYNCYGCPGLKKCIICPRADSCSRMASDLTSTVFGPSLTEPNAIFYRPGQECQKIFKAQFPQDTEQSKQKVGSVDVLTWNLCGLPITMCAEWCTEQSRKGS